MIVSSAIKTIQNTLKLCLLALALAMLIPSGVVAQDLSDENLPDELVEKPEKNRKRKVKPAPEKSVRAETREKKEKAKAKNRAKKKNKKMPLPKEPDKWHFDVQTFYVAKEDEFFKNGYARLNGDWYPVFILRRFKMMSKQYEHYLVIKGRPSKIPKVKGMALVPFGFEVRNEGFEYALPTFASVDRGQKKQDEITFTRMAELKVQEFGFELVKWMEDNSRKTENIVNTWTTN